VAGANGAGARELHVITGGGGFLGAHLATRLVERGRRVRILDLAPGTRPLPEGVVVATGDVRDEAAVKRALAGAAVVHHLAFVQSYSRRPEREQRAVALDGTKNVLVAARAEGARRVVFTSTIEIYGTHPPLPCPEDAPKDPVGLYGRLKWEAEGLAVAMGKAFRVPVVALRMPTICGPGASYHHAPLLTLLERALAGRALAVVGPGVQQGDLVHLDDVCDAYALAADAPAERVAGEAFNIASGAPATHLEIVQALAAGAAAGGPGRGRARIFVFPRLAFRLLVPFARTLALTELDPEQEGYLLWSNVYAVDKARERLGYAPRRSTVEAARALIDGYRAEREATRARAAAHG